MSLFGCARVGAALLLVLSIVVPTILQPVKLAVLAVALACMTLQRETWIAPATPAQLALDFAALGYSLVGRCWPIYGLARGNRGRRR